MKKLRNALAVVLLAMPVVTLNANPIVAEPRPADLQATPSVQAWCYVNMGGYWWWLPC